MSKSSRKYRVGLAVCSVMCRGGFRRSVCERFPSRLSGRRRRRLLVSLRAGSDEKMEQDRSEKNRMDVMLTSRPSYAVCTLLSLPLLSASDIPGSKMQFLLAVSHSMGAHMEAFRQRGDDSSSSSSSEEDAETEAPTATTESSSADAAAKVTLWCHAAMHDSARHVHCGSLICLRDVLCAVYEYHHGDVRIFKHEITNAPVIDNVKP